MGNEAKTPSFPYSTKYGMENEAVAHWLEWKRGPLPIGSVRKEKIPPM